jgi:hypothetical protein
LSDAAAPSPARSGSIPHRARLFVRRTRQWRPTGPRLRGLGRSLFTSYLALGVTLYVLPGRQSSGPLAVGGLVLTVALVGLLLQPVLAALTIVLGSPSLLVLGVLSQAIILDVAIAVAPNVDLSGGPEVLLVSWVAAVVAAVVNWLADAGSEDVFLTQLLGRAVREAHRSPGATDARQQGLLIVQLDGVGEDVLRQAITAGDVPTLAAWLQAGTHTLRGWNTGLPSTTPAGQAVLLHGDVTEVPSFRWFEKDTGRLMVANHPRDAAEVQKRISDGHGLLAEGGVSISNLFSGDAPTCVLTMSDAHLPTRGTRALVSFTSGRAGLPRSLVVWTGQVLIELYQGRRQRQRDVRPRTRRGFVFAVQRAATTALLHDLTVALVSEQLTRGAPVVFVDFLDYDEVAHHAGPSRPESMRTLDGLDRLMRFFTDVIRETGRDYEIALVSDHGQAQGTPFAQLGGASLHDVVASLVDTPVAPTNMTADDAPAEAPLVVVAAGNLAHVYLATVPGRVHREQIDALHPRLINGLLDRPGVGVVLVRSESDLLALGPRGWRALGLRGVTGGDGEDPLAAFGPGAEADLWAFDARRHVGDLVILGRVDPDSGEVASFEDLVGSHGGLGGAQTRAMVMHPSNWDVPRDKPLGGSSVHHLLRAHLPAPRR